MAATKSLSPARSHASAIPARGAKCPARRHERTARPARLIACPTAASVLVSHPGKFRSLRPQRARACAIHQPKLRRRCKRAERYRGDGDGADITAPAGLWAVRMPSGVAKLPTQPMLLPARPAHEPIIDRSAAVAPSATHPHRRAANCSGVCHLATASAPPDPRG